MPGTQHKRVNNLWESGYTDPETGEKAGRFPKLFPLASPAYASWVERLNFEQMEHDRTHYGLLIPAEPYASGVPGGVEWGQPYSKALAAFASPIPSYAQVAEVLPPLEATALASAEQKYNTGLVTVLTASSEDEFQAAYDDMIASLIDTRALAADLRGPQQAVGRLDGVQRHRRPCRAQVRDADRGVEGGHGLVAHG